MAFTGRHSEGARLKMKSIVITGSGRGIGFGLAREFLTQGCEVVISDRTAASTARAYEALCARFPRNLVIGQPCEVGSFEQVQDLWKAALKAFGKVDIWINNAGTGHPHQFFWNIPLEFVDELVDTNVKGVMYGSRVALQGMEKQGFGQIYNMEGLGSIGPVVPGTVLYAATKSTVTFLTKGLSKETASSPVQVCYLNPGIVVTDLLLEGMQGYDNRKARRFFNIMGDKVETVTPFLVAAMLKNQRNGARITWLPLPKLLGRLLLSPFNQRELFSDSQLKSRSTVACNPPAGLRGVDKT
jgi:NAD(P)-dependent dehydrogenase (short-subunit alcohol dehydrogenase family)